MGFLRWKGFVIMRGERSSESLSDIVPWNLRSPIRFDGPPRVVCAGFQLNGGTLVGPRDMFDDPGFDGARTMANEVADYFRRHGPFQPHRLPLDEMEYTTLPAVRKKLEGRFEKLD